MEPSKSTENVSTPTSNSSTNNIQLVLLVIAIVVAIVALIVAFIALSQKGTINLSVGGSTGGLSSGKSATGSFENRIWSLALGHSNSRNQYIDEVTGELKGFNVDIITAVCKIANRNCRIVFDLWLRCWDSEEGQVARGGVGLMDGWYDGCIGWYGTIDRFRTFTFSLPYNKGEEASLYVKKGSPFASSWSDMAGKKIGIMDGSWTDEFCLLRNQDQFDTGLNAETQIIHYFDNPELLDAVNNGDVSYAFIGARTAIVKDLDRVQGDPHFPCARQGPGVMLRKDKTELLDWFNPALTQLMKGPEYRDICRDVEEIHGHKTGLSSDEICFL